MVIRTVLWILVAATLTSVMGGDEEERAKAHRKMVADLQEARVLFNDKKYEQAEKAFAEFTDTYAKKEHAELIDPEVLDEMMLEAQVGLMDTMARLRKLEALKTYSSGKRTAKPSVRNHLLEAKAKLWNRDRDGYEKELRAALDLDEESYLAWFMLGEFYYSMRKEARAIEHLEKSLEHNEDFAESLYLLGQIYLRKGDKVKTRKYWNSFLENEPRTGSRFEYVNNTLLKMGGG